MEDGAEEMKNREGRNYR